MELNKVLLTPKPSAAIVKFWQGIVEVILRSACIALTVLVLICCIAAVRDLGEPETSVPAIEALRFNTRSPSGWLLLVTLLALPVEIVILIVRFLNFPIINNYSAIFLSIDVVIDFVLAAFYFGGAVALGIHATEWAGWRTSGTDMENTLYGLYRIVPSVGAESAFSFFASFGFIALGVWMILFVILRWNNPLVDKYIHKPMTVMARGVGSQEDIKPVTMTNVESEERLEFKEDLSEN